MRKNLMSSVSPLPMILVISLIYINLPVAQAQYFSGPAATAIGGAGRAAVDPLEAGALNPAVLAHMRRYYVGVNYSTDSHRDRPNTLWGATIADATEGTLFPASFSFLQKTTQFTEGSELLEKHFRLSAADMIYTGLAFGASVERLQQEFQGGKHAQHSGDISLLYSPTDWMGIAFVYYNLWGFNESVPQELTRPSQIAIGFHWLYKKFFRVRLDVLRQEKFNPGRKGVIMGGFETFLHKFFAIRGGLQVDDINKSNFVTAGFGWRGPKLKVDYAFANDLQGRGGFRHLFDFWMPF